MIVCPCDAEGLEYCNRAPALTTIYTTEAPFLRLTCTKCTPAEIQPQTQNECWFCTIRSHSISISFEPNQQATLVAAINSDDAPCPSMHTGRYPIPQSFETVFGRQRTSCSLPRAPPQKVSCLFLLIRFIR